MSVSLLNSTRKINNLLKNNSQDTIVDDISKALSDVMSASVLVFHEGEMIATCGILKSPFCEVLLNANLDVLNREYLDSFATVNSTRENVNLTSFGFSPDVANGYFSIVTPIISEGVRVATLVVTRYDLPYDIDDIILSEYVANIIALVLKTPASTAASDMTGGSLDYVIDSLTKSERKGAAALFKHLNGTSSDIVVSNISKESGVTRSLIVNALRKLEGAGVIKTKSFGMKGTHVEVINSEVFDRIKE